MEIVPPGVLVVPAAQLIGLEKNEPPVSVVTALESKEKPNASAGSAENPADTAREPPIGTGVTLNVSDPAAAPR
jgi:hypothetical protein